MTRQILCFIDFLGTLYCGYSGKKTKKGRVIVSEPWKVKKFIAEVLGEIDLKYSENGELLYDMYRHGLMHLYQPKIIKQKNGRILQWAIYKGQKERHPEGFDTQVGKFVIPDAKHLDIVVDPRDNNSDLLTISITCLYKDLLAVIDRFYQIIEENKIYILQSRPITTL